MTASISSLAQNSGAAAPDSSRTGNRAKLDKAAQQFEAMFINMMLKEARKTSFGDPLQNDAGKTFREMQDQNISKQMAQHGSLGLAKAIADYMERAQPASVADVQPREAGK